MASHSKTGLTQVAPDAWAVITSIIPLEGCGPNAGFLLASHQVLIIDTLISPGIGRQLWEYLRQVTDKPPILLINTNHLGDHVLGDQVFSPPAITVAHENVRYELLLRGEAMVKSFAEQFSGLVPAIEDATIMAPQVTYRHRMTLYFGGRTVELIHPGITHTNGDTMIYLPAQKLLYAGDILFNHIFLPMFGSNAGWIATIERLENMDIKTIVPGHGFIATKKELSELKQCLIALRHQVKDCFARGLSPRQTSNEVDLPYLQWPRSRRLGQDVEAIYEELRKEELSKTLGPQ